MEFSYQVSNKKGTKFKKGILEAESKSEAAKKLRSKGAVVIKLKKVKEEVFEKAFGSWKKVKGSLEYVNNIREGWKNRRRRLKL